MGKKEDRAENRPQRKIGYARVSTEDQNLHLQLDALRAAGCAFIHRDNGVSGVAASRPGLKKALASLREGDTLVIWKLDRLGRSLAELIAIMADLERRGIGFRSLSESIDTTTPGGRLVFHVMGALAEFERGLISERTKAGMASARARGVHVGRPSKLTRSQIARAERILAAKKATVEELAKEYGVAPLTLRRALKPRSGF
jgi:DNA invertase Pin-like site-specific DNA recombinase